MDSLKEKLEQLAFDADSREEFFTLLEAAALVGETHPGIQHAAHERPSERADRRALIEAEHLEAMLRDGWKMCIDPAKAGYSLIPPVLLKAA